PVAQHRPPRIECRHAPGRRWKAPRQPSNDDRAPRTAPDPRGHGHARPPRVGEPAAGCRSPRSPSPRAVGEPGGGAARARLPEVRGVRGLRATAVVVAGATFARGLGPWLESDDFGILALARIGEGGGGPASWLAFGPGRTWGYRPVVLALAGTFLSVFGTNGLAYHMASLATHLAAGLVLLALLHRPPGPGGPGIALLGPVLFFLVHPTADESVYWFSAIVYPLAALCGLGALWFFVRGLEATPVGRRVGFLGASAAAYGLALLSHPLAVAFAPALLLVPPARGVLPRRWERMALALPHLAAAAGLLLLTVRLGSPNAFGNVEADAGDAVRAGLELVGSTLALRPDAPAALAGLEALGVVAMVT